LISASRATPNPRFAAALRALFVGYLLVLAAAIFAGVFVALPVRYWLVDVPAAVLMLAAMSSAVGLVFASRWGVELARRTGQFALLIGVALVAGLANGAAALRAVYGPLGQAGVMLFLLIMLLVLPYLIVAPVLMLLWIGPKSPTVRVDSHAGSGEPPGECGPQSMLP
jgi:hypothetical protein